MARKIINPSIINIVRNYKRQLVEKNIKINKMFLFGSFAKGNPHKWSDIDVAVISDNLTGDRIDDYVKLRTIVDDFDLRIEPHAFTSTDFSDRWNPLASEVKKYGIEI